MRSEAGLNQREVAEAMQESTLFVSRCERGERRMDAVELLAYCQAVGRSPSQFIQRLEEAIKGS